MSESNNDPKPFGLATLHDVHNTANDLRKLISGYATKDELEKHYSTNHYVLEICNRYSLLFITLIAVLCATYYYLTPVFIRSETNKLEEKLDRLLMVTEHKTKK
jgi:hypothetical protein